MENTHTKTISVQSKSNTIFQTQILTEIAILSALSGVLYAIRPFPGFPFGGAITFASHGANYVDFASKRCSRRRHHRSNLRLVGFLYRYTLLGCFLNSGNPFAGGSEYPVAFGLIGLTGIFHSRKVSLVLAGAGLSVFLRFLVHYFVGVFVWYYVYSFPEFGQYVWPAVYNGSFLLAEFVISAILLVVLVKRGTFEYRLRK